MQNRLDNDLIELESMLKEIGAALNNIAKQKAQGSLVKKEKIAIKKTLSRIKNDGIQSLKIVRKKLIINLTKFNEMFVGFFQNLERWRKSWLFTTSLCTRDGKV